MNFFRKHLDSKVSKIIAVIIIIIFLTLEFATEITKTQNHWLLKVGEIEYTLKDWQGTYKALTQDPMAAQEAIANPSYAKQRVMDELVRNAIILQEAQRVGFSVNDKMVANEIIHMKMFKDDNGKFDKLALEKTLKNNNLTEVAFIKAMKEQIVRNNLMDMFYNTNTIIAKTTSNLLTKLIAADHNMDLYYVQAINKDIKYTTADLQQYLDEHKLDFTADDKAEISTISFNNDMIQQSDIQPTQIEIQSLYEQKSEYEPEKRLINQIVISSHNEAEQVLEKIRNGKYSYNDAATLYIKQQLIPYEIGPLAADGFDQDIAKIIFILPEGGISELVQTPIGWHIFRVVKIIPQKQLALSDIKDKIVNELINKKLSEKMHNLVKDVTIAIDENNTLEDIASKFNLSIKKQVISAHKLQENHYKIIKGINNFSENKILQAVFNDLDNGIKLISSQDNKAFIILVVEKIIPGQLMNLEQVQGDLIKAFTKDIHNKKNIEMVQELRQQVLDNPSKHIRSPQHIVFSRMKENSDIPECIQEKIIALYNIGTFNGSTLPCQYNDGYGFIVMKELNFNVKLSEMENLSIMRTVNSIYNEILFNQFIEHLKGKYKVKLNDNFIKYMNE